MKKILMITALCAVIMASVGCNKNENVDQEVNNPNINVGEELDNKEPEVVEPEVVEPEVNEPEVVEPEVNEPEVIEPEVNEPEVVEPEVSEPEVVEPEVSEPEVTEPEVSEPEVVEPGTSQAYLDLEKIINEINENAKVQINAPFNMEITSEASFTYLGLAEEDYTNKVEVGVANESMMMPSNHSFCLLKVKEGTDIAALKQSIFDNCNPRKWICMSAQYVLVAGNGDYVMLAMSSKENCENLLKEFEAKFGKDTNVLQRVAEE